MNHSNTCSAWLLFCTVACFCYLAACDDDPASPPEDAHAKAKRLWSQTGSTTYDMSQWRDCFCFLGGQEVMLQVRDDSLIAGTLAVQNRALTDEERRWYLTVDELFTFIDSARAASPASLVVEYDSLFGYPRRISVDYSTQMADEEITYRSANLVKR